MSKLFLSAVALCFGTWSASPAFAQQVSLTMSNGRVTLKAQNATVRQILDEWARVGGTKIVNAEKIASQPVTLTLIDEPEGQAIDTILRSAAGYMVAERANPTPTGSRFERIMVMARSTPVTTPSTGTSNQNAVTPVGPMPPGGAIAEGPVSADEDEPPQPMAPVVNPYSHTNPGGVPNANPGGLPNPAGPGAVPRNSAATTNGVAGAASPAAEQKFDYANPQKYFQQQQQLQQGNPMQPYPGVPVSTTGSGLGTGTATTTSSTGTPPPAAIPGTGAAGTISPPTNTNSQNPYSPNFNPYNLPPGQGVPTTGTPPPTTPVQPDRAKYANPYVQPGTQPPPQ